MVRSVHLSRAAMRPLSTTRPRAALGDARGAIATEYAVVVGVCAILISAALVSLGPPLVASYESARGVLNAPVP